MKMKFLNHLRPQFTKFKRYAKIYPYQLGGNKWKIEKNTSEILAL